MRGLVLMLALLLSPLPAWSHGLEPGFLDLRPLGGSAWAVLWKVPNVGGQPMRIEVVLPETCTQRRPPPLDFDGRAFFVRWVTTCPDGLEGGKILIEGLARTATDVLVRYELVAGTAESHRLTASETGFVVPVPQGALGVLQTYIGLGISHILGGIDHLMFVFGLMLLVRAPRRLVGAVTAFTLAHSLTLVAASLGWIAVASAPVEASIALSIMFLAAELLRPEGQAPRLSARRPWLVAFSFGLLHGFGFAGALKEIGLPQADVPLALFSFNVGVEIGQLGFIAAVLGLYLLLRRVFSAAAATMFQRGGKTTAVFAYALGGAAAWMLLTRLAAF